MDNKKVHFKMYKAGKVWLIAGISVASFSGMMFLNGNSTYASSDNTQISTEIVDESTTKSDSSEDATNAVNNDKQVNTDNQIGNDNQADVNQQEDSSSQTSTNDQNSSDSHAKVDNPEAGDEQVNTGSQTENNVQEETNTQTSNNSQSGSNNQSNTDSKVNNSNQTTPNTDNQTETNNPVNNVEQSVSNVDKNNNKQNEQSSSVEGKTNASTQEDETGTLNETSTYPDGSLKNVNNQTANDIAEINSKGSNKYNVDLNDSYIYVNGQKIGSVVELMNSVTDENSQFADDFHKLATQGIVKDSNDLQILQEFLNFIDDYWEKYITQIGPIQGDYVLNLKLINNPNYVPEETEPTKPTKPTKPTTPDTPNNLEKPIVVYPAPSNPTTHSTEPSTSSNTSDSGKKKHYSLDESPVTNTSMDESGENLGTKNKNDQTSKAKGQVVYSDKEKTLPQTDESKSNISTIAGIILLAFVGLFSFKNWFKKYSD